MNITKSAIDQIILNRFIQLSEFYGEGFSTQSGDLKDRCLEELKQRFEELLFVKKEMDRHFDDLAGGVETRNNTKS